MLNIGSFIGSGLSCLSSLTDQTFVSILHSVQLCKELTEKTDHGSEIRGKLRMTQFCYTLVFSLHVDVFKLPCFTHRHTLIM